MQLDYIDLINKDKERGKEKRRKGIDCRFKKIAYAPMTLSFQTGLSNRVCCNVKLFTVFKTQITKFHPDNPVRVFEDIGPGMYFLNKQTS